MGDSWDKQKTFVQFQHSNVTTFLQLNIYGGGPLPHTTISLVKFQH